MDIQNKAFAYVTKLVVPVLAIIAAVLTAQKNQNLTYALLSLAALSIATAVAWPIFQQLRTRHSRWHDDRLACRMWPDICNLIERFGAFVSSSRCDTIHSVFTNPTPEWRKAVDVFQQRCPLSLNILTGMWLQVSRYAMEPVQGFRTLVRTAAAFEWLLHTYNYEVIQVIFVRSSHEFRPLLTDSNRSALESVRERYNRLIDDYDEFVRSVNNQSRSQRLTPAVFPRSGPL